jgi:hypothetical protein
VEESRIRWAYIDHDEASIKFDVGDYIEVLHKTSEDEAEGWCLSKIIYKRDEFYFVHYENYENIYDEIVIEKQIRPVNARGGPKLDEIERQVIDIPKDIVHWFSTPDWDEKTNTIIQKTGVYNLTFRPKENIVSILGEKKPVEKACILMKFIIDHQYELVQLDNENLSLLKSIESRKQKIKSDYIEEVLVPKEFLGLIIGKQGSNITYIKQEYNVGVQIIETNEDPNAELTETEIPEGKALVRIIGRDSKWVKQAKKDIYLQKKTYEIDADKVDYFKGFQNSIVNDMKEKSGCLKMFIHDPEPNSEKTIIESIGNEDSLERLELLLDEHLSYYGKYQEKENQSRDLTKQYNKMNVGYADYYQPEGHKSQNQNRRWNKKY